MKRAVALAVLTLATAAAAGGAASPAPGHRPSHTSAMFCEDMPWLRPWC